MAEKYTETRGAILEINTIFQIALIGLISWVLATLYTFNGSVSELTQHVENIEKESSRHEHDLKEMKSRIRVLERSEHNH